MSSITDYTDRAICILFGDGAGSVLVTADNANSDYGIIDTICKTDGIGQNLIYQKTAGSRLPASHKTVDAKAHYICQEGQNVFKAAVIAMSEVVIEIMTRNHLTAADITYLVPHQANQRIYKLVADRVAIPMEKVMLNINKYGNTTVATIPLCLWDYEQKLKKK